MSEIISIKNLAYKWPGMKENLLEMPEFSVKKGESLFLMGASGSGKSTFLSLLGGVIVPQTGKIEVLGKDITQLGNAERDEFRANHLGFIFQQFNLVPYLSVIDNVTLPCRFSEIRFKKCTANGKLPNDEAKRLLEHLGISGEELLNKPVTELSVGQQQRVAAARALIGSPEILIADEPTSSLDADAQEAFIQLLFQECKAQNSTLVFVSHDTRFARFFTRTTQLISKDKSATQNIVEGGKL